MLYKSDIANLALGHLGVSQTVGDLSTENTLQAKIIRRNFRLALDTMLEAHEWGFATQFAELALVEESPIPGYSFCYAMPSDALVMRVLAIDGEFPLQRQYESQKHEFREVYNGAGERLLYTNVERAHGEYTTRLSEEIAFPSHFGRGLSHQLALDIAPSLITNNFPKVKAALMDAARYEISRAMASDLGRQTLLQDSPSPFFATRLR